MSGIPPWESELCEATQVVWVSSSEDELFAATLCLQSTFDNIHDMLGSGPAERPQELSLCLTPELVVDH